MGRLFGTDGVRGIVNELITGDLAFRLGQAGAHALTSEVHKPRILVANDSRASADMLTSAITAGILSVGAQAIDLGTLPTPGVACLVRQYGADAAVMISASHNSMEFNGIKWFSGEGYKLSDALEARVEAIVLDGAEEIRLAGAHAIGRRVRAKRAAEDYCAFLCSQTEARLDGLRIVIDGANGAASAVAPEVFRRLGAQVVPVHCAPDGTNINAECGSTHPGYIQQKVTEEGADAGLAFDGDADRLIAVDSFGRLVDGDRIMAILALSMKARGTLKNDTLVATVMSNLGLIKAMEKAGIKVVQTAVGDRYVLEHMLANGLSLGGEQSGHVIPLERTTTGDGILTAILLMEAVATQKKSLAKLANTIKIYPQTLVNVSLSAEAKDQAMADESVKAAITKAEEALGKNGRVLVRASGTEPLLRIMLEGEEENFTRELARSIAHAVVAAYGGEIRI